MKMTFTNVKHMAQQYDFEGAEKILSSGGLVLLPTDTLWSIACLPSHTPTLNRLIHLKRQNHADNFELLVSSVSMLKQYVAHLHPRLETLLAYHLRPLTMIFDNPINLSASVLSSTGNIHIRVVQDPFCSALLDQLNGPLISTFACIKDGAPPINFGAISSEIIQGVDHVVKYRQNDKGIDELPVMVKLLEDQEELEFIRE
jgi:L-threonylcarbamoyladenylate synthase